MKRILLVCCIFAGSYVTAFAQSGYTPDPVSKPEFIVKVDQLKMLINAGNISGANAKWAELSQMINGELMILNYRMRTAADAHNEAEQTHFQQLTAAQRRLSAEALQMKTTDMVANKVQIDQKLTAFAAEMI